MSKELGKDMNGVQKVMTGPAYLADALGQVPLNSISVLTGQMTYFYTNEVGMAAAAVGTVLLVAKIVDAITDLIMGKIVDNTNSKYGKARPWLLRMIIPVMVALVILFTVPKANEGIQLGYALLTNIFVSAICYTAIAVPFYTMMAYKTKSSEEKGKMGTYRSAVGYAIGVALGIGLIPITDALGGDQAAWVKFAVIMAILSGIGLFIAFKGSKELYAGDEQEQAKERSVSIFKGLGMLLRNTYWIKITVFGVCMNIMYAMIMAAPIYYAQCIVEDPGFYSIINTVNIIPSVIGFLTVGILIKKFGLARTAKYASIIGIVGCIVRCIFPDNVPVALIFGSVVMYATIPLISVLPAMVLNTAEVNMKNYGVRITGMTNASNSFVGKIGSGVGSAAMGWVLAAGGFDAVAAGGAITESVKTAVYALNIYIPLAMFVIMLIILAKYDLEDKLPAMMAENDKKAVGEMKAE